MSFKPNGFNLDSERIKWSSQNSASCMLTGCNYIVCHGCFKLITVDGQENHMTFLIFEMLPVLSSLLQKCFPTFQTLGSFQAWKLWRYWKIFSWWLKKRYEFGHLENVQDVSTEVLTSSLRLQSVLSKAFPSDRELHQVAECSKLFWSLKCIYVNY